MQHIVVSLAEKAAEYYDGVVDQYGRPRRIFLTTPHFLTVPLLIATVPRELGRIFSAYKAIRIVDTPIALPRFRPAPALASALPSRRGQRLAAQADQGYVRDVSGITRLRFAPVPTCRRRCRVMNAFHDSLLERLK